MGRTFRKNRYDSFTAATESAKSRNSYLEATGQERVYLRVYFDYDAQCWRLTSEPELNRKPEPYRRGGRRNFDWKDYAAE